MGRVGKFVSLLVTTLVMAEKLLENFAGDENTKISRLILKSVLCLYGCCGGTMNSIISIFTQLYIGQASTESLGPCLNQSE